MYARSYYLLVLPPRLNLVAKHTNVISWQLMLVPASRPPHKSLHVVGESKLASQLVKHKASSYTVLEKRALV
jgi:hypothetical protein